MSLIHFCLTIRRPNLGLQLNYAHSLIFDLLSSAKSALLTPLHNI